jgi:pentatricopeptide repeat protein
LSGVSVSRRTKRWLKRFEEHAITKNGPEELRIWNDMKAPKAEPCVEILNCVISALSREENGMSAAMDLYNEEFKAAGLKPNEKTHQMLIDGFIQNGNVDESKSFFHLMETADVSKSVIVNVANLLIDRLLANKDFENALSLLKEMKDFGIESDVTLNSLVSDLLKSDDISRVNLVFKQMKQVGMMPDSVTLNSMIHLLLKHKDYDQAFLMLEESKDAGIQLDARINTLRWSLEKS